MTSQLHQQLREPGAALDDALLVVSELVSNAVQAGSTLVATALELHREGLRVTVTDEAAGWPTMQPFSQTDPRGRGLRLVDTIAAEWDVSAVRDGKKVWADIAVDENAASALHCTR